MTKKLTKRQKTVAERALDEKKLDKAMTECADACLKFCEEMWSYEWNIKYISFHIVSTIVSSAERLKIARERKAEGFVGDTYDHNKDEAVEGVSSPHYYENQKKKGEKV